MPRVTNLPPPRPPVWGPPPPPPPPRGGLLGLWLGLAAIVLLVVGAGATVVVLQPWDDDSGPAQSGGVPGVVPTSPERQEQDGEVAAEPTTTAPTLPTDAPSTAPSPAPRPAAPVTADLDGDGRGDAVAVVGTRDGIARLTLTSTGEEFRVEREPLSTYDDSTWADFDGDGRLDQVSWSYRRDGRLVLTSLDLTFHELDVPLRLDGAQPYVTLKAADVDGDGAPDLIAYGATAPERVGVWVLRNLEGGFAKPELAMRMPHTTYATTTVLPGDFTGDGAADLVVRVLDQPRRGPVHRYGLTLLASTRTGFVPSPLQRPTALIDDADLVVGDFAGDGTPRVLVLGPGRHGLEVQSLRVVAGHLVRDRRHDVEVGGPGTVTDAVTSDVDGDGVDDVVYTTRDGHGFGGFRVLQVRDLGRAPSRRWARTPACPARSCTLYFENGY